MEGTSKMKDVNSPEDIEEGIESTTTVTWDPFTVLPKEIYLMIFNMLERAEDKRNIMNAHVNWYHLFKSQRVLFIFEPVFKIFAENDYDLYLESVDFGEHKVFNAYEKCRLVCKDWDNGFQTFFQLHGFYFRLDCLYHRDDIWSPNSNLRTFTHGTTLESEICNSLTLFSKEETDEILKTFSITHPPSKNPIFSRSISLEPFGLGPEGVTVEEVRRFRKSVDTLLERYGKYIWHCKIEIRDKLNPEACICIGKWISLMSELKTLRLKYEKEVEPLSMQDLQEIEDTEVIQSDMKNLVVLKSSYLPAIPFRKLVGNIPKLQVLQIKIFKGEDSFLRGFELITERENMKVAFLTVKGHEDFEYLQGSEPFPNLKELTIAFEFASDEERKNKAYSRWPEWRMIFKILEEKFPALEDLKLRLPKAVSKGDKIAAIDHSLECHLNLPKLKKLWVALPNLCSLDFLNPCKALEELTVVLEHSEWNLKSSKALSGIRRGEKIKFNINLKNMWESNIWEKFPKLRQLTFRAWCEAGISPGFHRYHYSRRGEKKKSYVCTNPKKNYIFRPL